MPHPVQTWYDLPCELIGQLILRCQHPRHNSTAALATPVASKPTDQFKNRFFLCSNNAFSLVCNQRYSVLTRTGNNCSNSRFPKMVLPTK